MPVGHRVAIALTALITATLVGCADDDSPAGAGVTPTAGVAPSATTAPPALAGTAYYVENVDGGMRLWSVRGGTVTEHLRIAVRSSSASPDYCVGNSLIVSPDGQWVAWVTDDREAYPDGATGKLRVSHLDGTNERTLDGVYCNLDDLSWTPDSGKLAVSQAEKGHVFVDVGTGATETREFDSLQTVWSPNRSFRVRRGTEGNTFRVEKADGTVVRTVVDYTHEGFGFEVCGFTLKGVSNDGRYVTIGGCSTDPSRVLGAHFLYDTAESKHVTLPVSEVHRVWVTPDDHILIYGSNAGERQRLILMSPTGEVTETIERPVGLPDKAGLLTYAPNAR